MAKSLDTVRQPRQRKPALELPSTRTTSVGYEAVDGNSTLRCLDHGYPTPLARWHYHDEYELHHIVASSGKAFVGDWIGQFSPGHLVLTGPRLPHNWISHDVPADGIALRDQVIQFDHAPLVSAAQTLPELTEVMPLLERSRHGVEFFGLSEAAGQFYDDIKASHGLDRFALFCKFLSLLSRATDYRLLSSAPMQGRENADSLDQINRIVNLITEQPASAPSLAELAARHDLTTSAFSRFFVKATGNTYTDFVNHVRVNRACQLLMESDRFISQICFDVGYNNLANFNRRFLAIKGMTPREYRQQAGNRFGAVARRD